MLLVGYGNLRDEVKETYYQKFLSIPFQRHFFFAFPLFDLFPSCFLSHLQSIILRTRVPIEAILDTVLETKLLAYNHNHDGN